MTASKQNSRQSNRSATISRAVRPNTDPVSAYAKAVVAGAKPAGPLVRLACQRHLDDLKSGRERGLRFDPDDALFAINFFGFFKHSKGEWAGRTLKLNDWQEFCVGSVFGWKRADGTRRFRSAYEEVPRKNGKALAVDTLVPTPSGWKRHGELQVGDRVFSPAGIQVRVLAATPHYIGPCRRVAFADGTEIVAHDHHEWLTHRTAFTNRKKGSRKPLPLVETEQIAKTLRHGARGDFVHSISVAEPLQTADAELPIPPYVFGAWLGDGHAAGARLTCADAEITARIASEGVPVRIPTATSGAAQLYSLADRDGSSFRFSAKLRSVGVLGDKHIPPIYLRSSIAQRSALLAGLIDTDGHITPRGQCELVLTNRRLFDGALELVRSLGLKPTVVEDIAKVNGREIGPRYRMQFWPTARHLSLAVPRKNERLRHRTMSRATRRTVTGCDAIGDRLVNCIEVEGGYYLAGEAMIATHNSTMLAGIGLLMLVADGEPGAEIYTAATKKDQARIIFGEAQRMVRRSPPLRDIVDVVKLNLSVPTTDSKFEPLSSDEKTADGLNPSAVLIDELHRHKTRALLDVLDTAMGARKQPLLWIITTAGDEGHETVYAQEHEYARKVVEGVLQDDSLFVYIATLDEDDDPFSPIAWAKANPNLGVSVKLDDMQRQADKARKSPSALNAFKRLRLNVRTSSAKAGIGAELWKSCGGPVNVDALVGRKCWAGLDLSGKNDLSALVLIFPPDDATQPADVLPFFWVPDHDLHGKEDRDRAPYARWRDARAINVVPGKTINYGYIATFLAYCLQTYRIEGIAFDRWRIEDLLRELDDIGVAAWIDRGKENAKVHPDGLRMFPCGQGFKDMGPCVDALEDALLDGRLRHGMHPVLTWNAASVVYLHDPAGARKPAKNKSTGRIDGIVALAMAAGLAARAPAHVGSIYDTRPEALLA